MSDYTILWVDPQPEDEVRFAQGLLPEQVAIP